MTFKSISTTDILAFIALFLFVGACSYVKDEREMVEEQENVEAFLTKNAANFVQLPDAMPLFAGCKDRACSDKALVQYIYENLKYPEEGMGSCVQGKVYIQFIIEKNGLISNAEVVRDIGPGYGKGALAVVQSMNALDQSWSPATKDGETVRSKYTLPITFRLETKEI